MLLYYPILKEWESFVIPETVSEYAFSKPARNFGIDERNQDFKVTDGKEIIGYPVNKKGIYIMLEILSIISGWNFMGNTYLAGIVFNNNIKKFDLFYLDGCYNFQKLVLSENTKSLLTDSGKNSAIPVVVWNL